MHVHRSNRVELLVEILAEVVARPLASPLASETIVVQSRGMQRWLSIELARRLGVWAGARFPFPRTFVEEVMTSVLGDGGAAGKPEPYGRERLTWWIARLLPELARLDSFAPIARYLSDDAGGHKLLGLSARIADVFDEYVVYRPELVSSWQRGEGRDAAGDAGWQAVLWRELVAHLGEGHPASRARRFLERWAQDGEVPAQLPERVSVFGVSTFPPVYLQVLEALSRRVEVHLYCFRPCREYLSDIRSRREIRRELRRVADAGGKVATAEELALAEGNPLLGSFGRVVRELEQTLEAVCDYQDGSERYVDPGLDSVLHTLQSDVLSLRHRGPGKDEPPRPLASDDRSLTIHACHSPTREVEVLRDQLRARFEADPSLSPQDVVVMAPDIETYAPLVEATLGGGRGDSLAIPYCIADRSNRLASGAVQAFTSVLNVLRGRLSASEVVDLLHHEPVRDRFGIRGEDLPLVTRWIDEAEVRWGVDAADRSAHGQPALDANTWRFGLRRLLLGYAMPGEGRELFQGTLPYDDVEGSSAEVLGRLVELCERLFERRLALQTEQSVARWVDELERLLAAMIAVPSSSEWEVQVLREALRALGERSRDAGFERPIGIEAIQALLTRELDADRSARQFLSGGVTFCAMLPMRSIPFRVVCLLGMNDGQFPRLEQRLGFDLMSAAPRSGDRSLRDEDRYLFLEALLSARDQLILSYVGRSVQDNSTLPPSVLVAELLDVIEASFCPSVADSPQTELDFGQPAPSVIDQLRVEHPLQPFSPRYFAAPAARNGGAAASQLFSYDERAAQGAAALVARADAQPRFLREPLPDLRTDGLGSVLSLDELAAFLENPARALLRSRLGLDLEDRVAVLSDREPIELDALERWAVGARMLELVLDGGQAPASALTGGGLESLWAVVQARGTLPAGRAGRCTFDDLVPDVRALAEMTRQHAAGDRTEPVEVRLDFEGTLVHGRLNDLWPGAQIRSGFSRVQPRHELQAWVAHLALQWAAQGSVGEGSHLPRRTVVVGRERGGEGVQQRVFVPLDANTARDLLGEMVRLYYLGQRVPLPFFAASSHRYVIDRAAQLSGRPEDVAAAERHALRKAREVFLPTDFSRQRGEAEDPYIARLFGETDPIGFDPDAPFLPFTEPLPPHLPVPSFTQLARAVYEPLLDCIEEAE